ncbi:MAG TPA: methyltransferase domain-containing protein [bacterium]|nr:methyltransferase domain-containing protein [bacterium]
MDIPRIFNISESAHRIHDPISPEKLAILGAVLRLKSGARVLDLGSGSGEMLCTWALDHGVTGIGVDMSPLFTEQAKLRAVELGVADQVRFIHDDAAGSISDFLLLPELVASFGRLGCDVVEMVLADQDDWDRYEAAKWLTMRRWLEANPGDEFSKEVRAKLTSEPGRYTAYTREYLGWGIFALMPR